MARILSIEQRGRGGRVVISTADGDWATVQREAVFACGVRRGDEATPELLERLQIADDGHRAYQASLLLLSYRPRSEAELETRLRRKGFGASSIEESVARLRRVGLVDDSLFARDWVEARGAGPGARGRSALKAELRAKGITGAESDAAIDTTDDEAGALAAARPRVARLHGLARDEFQRRLGSFLQRRGFSYDVAGRVVRELWREREEAISGTPPGVE